MKKKMPIIKFSEREKVTATDPIMSKDALFLLIVSIATGGGFIAAVAR